MIGRWFAFWRVRILMDCCSLFFGGTVDGSNPALADMVDIPLFTRFYTSQVVQDFSHQQ